MGVLWTALDSLFYDLVILKKDKDFYQPLSEMPICFGSA